MKCPLKTVLLLMVTSLLSLAGCNKTRPISYNEQPQPQPSMEDILDLDKTNYNTHFPEIFQSDDLRLQAMVEAAQLAGAQKGYSDRMTALLKQTDKMSTELDVLFDFRQLMLLSNHNNTKLFLLPPVIDQANNVVITDGSEAYLTTTSQTYQIMKKAKLVVEPPHWRSYLYSTEKLEFKPPALALAPATPEEKAMWQYHVKKGYQAGISQADNEFRTRVGNLKHDFTGMLRYLRLVDIGLVNEVKIDIREENTSGNQNELNLRQTTYQIVVQPSLNGDPSKYLAVVQDDRGSLRYPDELKTIANNKKEQDNTEANSQTDE